MPYMGVEVPDGTNNKINIKLHGVFDTFPISPVELRECARIILEDKNDQNIPTKVQNLASGLAKIFVDDKKVFYVNVEHWTSSNHNIYGASSDGTNKE